MHIPSDNIVSDPNFSVSTISFLKEHQITTGLTTDAVVDGMKHRFLCSNPESLHSSCQPDLASRTQSLGGWMLQIPHLTHPVSLLVIPEGLVVPPTHTHTRSTTPSYLALSPCAWSSHISPPLLLAPGPNQYPFSPG